MSSYRLRAGGAIAIALVAVLGAIMLSRLGQASQTPSSEPLDPTLVSELKTMQITVTPTSDESAISAEKAIEVAQNESPSTIGDAAPSATLVNYTNETYGAESSPAYVDRESWAVVFRSVPFPRQGPRLSSEQPSATYIADFVVFIDAKSGEFLNGVAIGVGGD